MALLVLLLALPALAMAGTVSPVGHEAGTVSLAGHEANTASPEEAVLDMAPAAFDDQYRGCVRTMLAALPALNRSEFPLNIAYAEGWALAEAEWWARGSPSPPRSPLPPAQAVALLAYTAPLPLHRAFNTASRGAGRSRRHYHDGFAFKALHFLLSAALATLRDVQGRPCHRVFRGVRGLRFAALPGRTVRFGHFASSSRSNRSSWAFGSDTVFHVRTCHGAAIRDFSFFPDEDEVLIPPFETFQVTQVAEAAVGSGAGARIWLSSTGTLSNYNCEWLREQHCGDRDGPCVFDAGRSILGDPPHLGGLLLVTVALAVATGTP